MLFGLFGRKDRAGDPQPDRRRLGASLLRLEINTIVKRTMTAETMPELPHALLDIAMEYSQVLLADAPRAGLTPLELNGFLFGGQRAVTAVPVPLPDAAAVDATLDLQILDAMRRGLRPNIECFSGLRQAALSVQARLDAARGGAGVADRTGVEMRASLLSRIAQNVETVLAVVKRLEDPLLIRQLQYTRAELADRFVPTRDARADGEVLRLGPYDVPPSDYLRLRKVWEIGTEEIIAQTVIQLDGDVVTRITPALMRADGKPLLEVHRQAVEASVGYWSGMVTTLATLVERAMGVVFRRRP